LYESQLKSILGKRRGSELRDSDLTIPIAVHVIQGYNCDCRC